ncbi:putative membrane protein [Moumouvirus maliensis]|nr:putative membrane protein [Moumouvirus maliensis]
MLMSKNNLSMLLSDFYEKINPSNNHTQFSKIFDVIKYQSSSSPNEEFIKDPRIYFQNIYDKIKTFSNGPLGYSIILSLAILFYIYFANNFIYYIIGLFIPGYWSYILLSDNDSTMIDIQNMMTYFVIFSHLEFITFIVESITSITYLKIAMVIFLTNILIYNTYLLKFIYEKLMELDNILITFIGFVLIQLYQESVKIMQKVNIVTSSNSKKQL